MSYSYSVYFWMRTTDKRQDFPAIATNKEWNGGSVRDYSDSHNYGYSRTTGSLSGWAIVLQPNGAWAWNLGDGEQRLDYQPTSPRQMVSDGEWHLLAFVIDPDDLAARIYYDGIQVALYSLASLNPVTQAKGYFGVSFGQDETLHEIPVALKSDQILQLFKERMLPMPFIYPKFITKRRLNMMSWNIWNGGREDGNDVGLNRVVEIIRKSGADVIAMQETYGSGPRIADALDYHLYLRSSNLSIISRYPAVSHHSYYKPFNLGGVTLQLSPSLFIDVFTLWLHYLPDFCKDVLLEGITPEALQNSEWDTRASEINQILRDISKIFSNSRLFIAGDFNCPSHLDWTDSSRHLHKNLAVKWPVSTQMIDAGFIDSYRNFYTDEKKSAGHTWTPRNPNSWQDRIDYIYHRGSGIYCVEAGVLNKHQIKWPSDHAAVFAKFEIEI